ncbi:MULTISPECIES: dTMP kinase [unclassified Campylobacter]|uniref:dTMP kinase n=1 Tax=unclassified Campylobacter TaxID=2593542 RepID=UPI00155811FB|nr:MULTISPECIES: dTMP kinase [unclassified Campylobacter]QKF92225.1 dTMP kinase [Campylobacter sp. CCUG 57310]
MYILFEGVDGVGKSTQIKKVAKFYENAVITYEPGGTELGKKLREILLGKNSLSKEAEILLFLADRAEHFDKVISKNKDKIILSDRGFISGMAYAMANENRAVKACDESYMKKLLEFNKFALQGNLPDKIVFFEADLELLNSRVFSRGLDHIESRGAEYLLKVQECMKRVLNSLDIKFLAINASDEMGKITNLIKEFIDD